LQYQKSNDKLNSINNGELNCLPFLLCEKILFAASVFVPEKNYFLCLCGYVCVCAGCIFSSYVFLYFLLLLFIKRRAWLRIFLFHSCYSADAELLPQILLFRMEREVNNQKEREKGKKI